MPGQGKASETLNRTKHRPTIGSTSTTRGSGAESEPGIAAGPSLWVSIRTYIHTQRSRSNNSQQPTVRNPGIHNRTTAPASGPRPIHPPSPLVPCHAMPCHTIPSRGEAGRDPCLDGTQCVTFFYCVFFSCLSPLSCERAGSPCAHQRFLPP